VLGAAVVQGLLKPTNTKRYLYFAFAAVAEATRRAPRWRASAGNGADHAAQGRIRRTSVCSGYSVDIFYLSRKEGQIDLLHFGSDWLAPNVPNQKFGHFKFWPTIKNLNRFQQSKSK
jgi:hypothetical protein